MILLGLVLVVAIVCCKRLQSLIVKKHFQTAAPDYQLLVGTVFLDLFCAKEDQRLVKWYISKRFPFLPFICDAAGFFFIKCKACCYDFISYFVVLSKLLFIVLI